MEKRDDIEKLILDNIETLNDNEPMEGHFARFEAKLNAQHKKKRTINLNIILKVAAAVVFVFLATNQAFIYFSPDNQRIFNSKTESASLTLASVSPEYQEVEYYYTSSINTGMEQWNKWIEEGLISEDEQTMMNNELAEFETLYQNLQKDLAANPNDERVINAMLEYYQAKLSVIYIIITKLEEVQQKTQEFEQETTAM
ncbi:hypothetical protein SAMN05444285_1478 [Draconibacterium orientale]|uniref:Uncharacterized protein n=1 Tax=Draconibacterium orientale TaxID=1168034 RepID=X5E6V6_9BACT|nr:hypothetical protein [Draconibacterium orientale]AHW62386.1 hypothetical protein FH5T_20655 [Draconibacterium orientale]SEU11215.1 hypothetical protein SAMN05444285_1478 [Draconibacterium orientale]